jgi:Fic family protein
MRNWVIDFNLKLDVSDPELVKLLAGSRALASVIRGIPLSPEAQARLDSLNIMRAVRGTTVIEGAKLSEREVRSIMASPGKQVLPPSRKIEEDEARNAQLLMFNVADLVAREPDVRLTEKLVREAHVTLTLDIPHPNNQPGQYRTVAVGAGEYVAPAPNEVPALMARFIEWFNQVPVSAWDPIVRALVAHFYLVSLHPFGDGNGRTSRGIESLLLYQAGINARGFYSLANFYYQNRGEYVRKLDQVRFESGGDLMPFVRFGLEGLEKELTMVHAEVIHEVKWMAFRDFARETLYKSDKLETRSGERLHRFLLDMGREPIVLRDLRKGNHPLYRLYRKLNARTLERDIKYLKDKELVIEEDGRISANLEYVTRF